MKNAPTHPNRRRGPEPETDHSLGHLPMPTDRFCGLFRNGGRVDSHLALLPSSNFVFLLTGLA